MQGGNAGNAIYIFLFHTFPWCYCPDHPIAACLTTAASRYQKISTPSVYHRRHGRLCGGRLNGLVVSIKDMYKSNEKLQQFTAVVRVQRRFRSRKTKYLETKPLLHCIISVYCLFILLYVTYVLFLFHVRQILCQRELLSRQFCPFGVHHVAVVVNWKRKQPHRRCCAGETMLLDGMLSKLPLQQSLLWSNEALTVLRFTVDLRRWRIVDPFEQSETIEFD